MRVACDTKDMKTTQKMTPGQQAAEEARNAEHEQWLDELYADPDDD
jgi:hypothetical protein